MGDFERFYPDLVEHGGLVAALQAALDRLGFFVQSRDLEGGIFDEERWKDRFPAIALVSSDKRDCQLFIGANERVFVFDLWQEGICMAAGKTPSLDDVARVLGTWTTTDTGLSEMSKRFPCIEAKEKGRAYEAGREIESAWNDIRKDVPSLAQFIDLALKDPVLSCLFPYTSIDMLRFSRCTGYPYTFDYPVVVFVEPGLYKVLDYSMKKEIGRGTAEEALKLVLLTLPIDCGPAIRGTADDLP